MKVIAPRFFSAFHCIADRCSDSCCIGWEIDVDPESEAFYRAQSGEIGNRLRAALEAGADNVYFRLGTDERCPFLNGQNLCDLYIALGPEHLCAICREHPRFYSWWGGFVEAGLGLCCEEACRLLLADERPLTFVESENDAPDEACELSEDELSFLLEARGKLFSVLQDRSLPIKARLRRSRLSWLADRVENSAKIRINDRIRLTCILMGAADAGRMGRFPAAGRRSRSASARCRRRTRPRRRAGTH